jgi:glycosyltransferase involved in cell wall biosynthesis
VSRVVTVYSPRLLATPTVEAGFIRWHRISAALARLGHSVDIASAELRYRWRRNVRRREGEPRIVPITGVRWSDYDAVKVLFHQGFETLRRYGGGAHPFIIAKLGSVVGPEDMEGIYFYGAQRERMYHVQEEISRSARYVTLLTRPALELWRRCFGERNEILLVPGAADTEIPPPHVDPYPPDGRPRAVFAGNFYGAHASSQPQAHRSLADRLNHLGAALGRRGARLYVVGPGDHRSLDPEHVTWCGAVPYEESWDYLHFATVGVVVAAGAFMHNNESTKIYSYLRAGLPVVSEAGFPNDDVVRESGLGWVVPNGDLENMADRVADAAHAAWDRYAGVRYVLEHHTWDQRARVYDRILRLPAVR